MRMKTTFPPSRLLLTENPRHTVGGFQLAKTMFTLGGWRLIDVPPYRHPDHWYARGR
jgi:hypothetical protein